MIVYYKSDLYVAKLNLVPGANLERVDAIMARDGMVRCTKQEYLQAKAKIHAEREVSQ